MARTSDLPRVTDHCVVRYLERVCGLDIESIRLHIAQSCAGAVAAGALSRTAEGAKFEFGNGSVITVVPLGAYPSKTGVKRVESRMGMV